MRLEAFSKSLLECGIENQSAWAMKGDYTLEGGMAAMERLLTLSALPTAVMCSNDMTAIGVLHTLYREGLRVPRDISVIGFDDIHIAQVTIPPLTTMEMSRIEIARAAVDSLRSELDGLESAKNRKAYDVRTKLVVRKSTGFPRGSMNGLSLR
jgi:DNA-binding LacI/PurR family transcriptional regulator